MNPLRKITVIIAGMLLPLFLFTFGTLFSINQVLSTPDRLKQSLKENNVYGAALTNVLNSNAAGGEGVSTNEAAVQDAVDKALPAQALEAQTSQVLDGIYAWLQGEASTIDFQVDLTGIQDELTTSLSREASERTATLPVCSGDMPVSNTSDFDPFTATCRPAGLTPANAAAITRQEIQQSDLFKRPTLTPNDFNQEGGKPLEEQLRPVSTMYDKAHTYMVASAIASVACIAIIMAASRPWRNGLRRVGIIFISVGAPSAVLALLSNWAIGAAVDMVNKSANNDAIQAAGIKAAEALTNDVRTWWLWYGVVLVALGIGALIWLRATRHAPAMGDGNTPPQPATQPQRAGRLNK